jgi:hypothetical protein
MSEPEKVVPGSTLTAADLRRRLLLDRASVAVLWLVSAIAVVLVLAGGSDQRMTWLTVILACTVVLAFLLQLAVGRSEGYIARLEASFLGAVVLYGVAGAIVLL